VDFSQTTYRYETALTFCALLGITQKTAAFNKIKTMIDISSTIHDFPLDGLRPLFDPAADRADLVVAQPMTRKYIRRHEAKIALDARKLENAIEHIGELPAAGQSYHMLVHKAYSMAHIVPAVLKLATPATISHLTVVTLSFSRENIADLLSMLDGGLIGGVDFVFSVYFRSREKENCIKMAEQITKRGGRVYSGLIHSKLLLIKLTDDRHFVAEASANLRSCASVEQIVLTADDGLYSFYRSWIAELMEAKNAAT
jgi:hypothetical protein